MMGGMWRECCVMGGLYRVLLHVVECYGRRMCDESVVWEVCRKRVSRESVWEVC